MSPIWNGRAHVPGWHLFAPQGTCLEEEAAVVFHPHEKHHSIKILLEEVSEKFSPNVKYKIRMESNQLSGQGVVQSRSEKVPFPG